MPIPPFVRLPMAMHSGRPARPLVAPGETVKVGQIIAEADGAVSSPVHASVSGQVKSIDQHDPVTGAKALSITIESDGLQTPFEGLAPPVVENTRDFLQAVSLSGVVGLGGAGYPTAHKLTFRDDVNLEYMLINGAECEPYITSDTRMMVDQGEYVVQGAQLMQRFLGTKQCLICIEDNKPEAIKKMRALCQGLEGISVHVLPSRYPQGERKLLVYNVTGRVVPKGARLPDVGCTVINCSTVAVFARYIATGEPLCSRIVTVDGPAVGEPKNVIAPIGAPIGALFDFCGGLAEDTEKVIMGGPMMGLAVPSLEMPVIKVTNSLLALRARKVPPQTACIKCGRCIQHCPIKLLPSWIENAFERQRVDLLEKYQVELCAECSCCEYVCPAKRPLAHVMVLSKQMIWEASQA